MILELLFLEEARFVTNMAECAFSLAMKGDASQCNFEFSSSSAPVFLGISFGGRSK